MILHGKAKIDFDRWLTTEHHLVSDYQHGSFFDLPPICQNALIIEWLDSVGIYVIIDYSPKLDEYSGHIIRKPLGFIHTSWLSTRQEATEEAIKKAVEIYNQQTKP